MSTRESNINPVAEEQGQLRYIAVEGPIGVGKSSLARRLATMYDAELILEEPDNNEFLPDFYRNSKRYALQTQLSFLIHRTRQLQSLTQIQLFDRVCLADFTLEKNQLFAELTLNEAEYKLYQQVQDLLYKDVIRPDLVIYLQADVDTLVDRIVARGIEYEMNIDAHYLGRICEAYINFFHNYDACPLLIINSENADFIHDDECLQELVDKLKTISFGRHYYNPLPKAGVLAFG